MALGLRAYYICLTFDGPPDRQLKTVIDGLLDQPCKPLMISSNFMIVGVMWKNSAYSLWKTISDAKCLTNVSEMLILEGNKDWCAQTDKPANGWLMRNLGTPGILGR